MRVLKLRCSRGISSLAFILGLNLVLLMVIFFINLFSVRYERFLMAIEQIKVELAVETLFFNVLGIISQQPEILMKLCRDQKVASKSHSNSSKSRFPQRKATALKNYEAKLTINPDTVTFAREKVFENLEMSAGILVRKWIKENSDRCKFFMLYVRVKNSLSGACSKIVARLTKDEDGTQIIADPVIRCPCHLRAYL